MSLVECLRRAPLESPDSDSVECFSELVSATTVLTAGHFSLLRKIICIFSAHFQLLRPWQLKILTKRLGELVGELVLNFDFLDSSDLRPLLGLLEDLVLLFVQLRDFDSAEFVLRETRKLATSSDVLAMWSVLLNVLKGKCSDADSALSLFDDVDQNNSFLLEMYLCTKIALFARRDQLSINDYSRLGSLVQQYCALFRAKRSLCHKYPLSLETLLACNVGLSTVVFQCLLGHFSVRFQNATWGLLLGTPLDSFRVSSQFLKFLEPLSKAFAQVSDYFFPQNEQSMTLILLSQLAKGKLGLFSHEAHWESRLVSPHSIYLVNCLSLSRALHTGCFKDFHEFLLHQKTIDLSLNTRFSFIFFKVISFYLNQNRSEATQLLDKVSKNYSQKDFLKDPLITSGMLQVLWLVSRLLGASESSPMLQNLAESSPSVVPLKQLQILLDSHMLFRARKLAQLLPSLLRKSADLTSPFCGRFLLRKLSIFEPHRLDHQVRLLGSSLDCQVLFDMLESLSNSRQYAQTLLIVEHILDNLKSLTWGHFCQFLTSQLNQGKPTDCGPSLPSSACPFDSQNPLRISHFLNTEEVTALRLLRGRLLVRLGLSQRASDFFIQMLSSPESMFFAMDWALFLVLRGDFAGALEVLDVDFYFQKCSKTSQYKDFESVFAERPKPELRFRLTELQLLVHCLSNLTGKLPKNQNSECISSKLDALQRSPSTSAVPHFRLELDLARGFILRLSELVFTRQQNQSKFNAFVDTQAHLLLILGHCRASDAQRFSTLEKMASRRQNTFTMDDFLACPSHGEVLDHSIILQLQQTVRNRTRLFVSCHSFLSEHSVCDLLSSVSLLRSHRPAKAGLQVQAQSVSPAASLHWAAPGVLGKLLVFLGKSGSQSCENLDLISNLKKNIFRSKVLRIEYSSTENLFQLRNIRRASQSLNFDKLKEASKNILRSEYKPEAIWGLVDSLLLKKKPVSSAEGFFKMLKKEQAGGRSTNLVFPVGLFLLQGGLFGQCLDFLNLLVEPQRLSHIPRVSDLGLGSELSKENQLDCETEYVYSKKTDELTRRTSRKQNHRSFYAVFDSTVLRGKRGSPQVAFLLGLYFYKIKRLDSSAKCFVTALGKPHLRVPSLLHLLDIALHASGYNLYSNHFHKEKYSHVSAENIQNVRFALSQLKVQSLPEQLRVVLAELESFIRILNSTEGSFIQRTRNSFWQHSNASSRF